MGPRPCASETGINAANFRAFLFDDAHLEARAEVLSLLQVAKVKVAETELLIDVYLNFSVIQNQALLEAQLPSLESLLILPQTHSTQSSQLEHLKT